MPAPPSVTTVSIPKTLASLVKKRIEGTSFKSVSAFVIALLEDIEREIERVESMTKDKDA